MTSRALLFVLLLLAGAVRAGAMAPSGAGFVVPASGFVLDGGDIEAAALDAERCVDPSLEPAHDPQAATGPRPMAFEYGGQSAAEGAAWWCPRSRSW